MACSAILCATLVGHSSAGADTGAAAAQSKAASNLPVFRSLAVGHTSGYVVSWDSEGRQDVALPPEVTFDYVSQSSERRIVSVAAGATFSMALTKSGSVIAWATNPPGPLTVPVEMRSGIKTIVAGAAHAYAITQEGRVIAWGQNTCGQMDVPPSAQSGVVAISTSYCHTLALKDNGTVVAWGTPPNQYECERIPFPPHQLKYCHSDYPAPGPLTVPEPARTDAASVHASDYGAYVVKKDGTVVAWYYMCEVVYDEWEPDSRIECGYVIQEPSNTKTSAMGRIPLEASTDVVEISSAGIHRIAVKRDGSIVEWGFNGFRYPEGFVYLRKGQGSIRSPLKVRGGQFREPASYWGSCTFALSTNGAFGVGCQTRDVPYVSGTPSLVWDRVLDFDARYTTVVALIGMADELPSGLKDVDSMAFPPRSRSVECMVYLFSNNPLLGPLAPPSAGDRPVRNLKPGYWLEYRPAGKPDAPWQAVYPWARLQEWTGVVPDVQLTFRCGTRASKTAKVPDFEIRVANTLGPGPSRSTVGPPPGWTG